MTNKTLLKTLFVLIMVTFAACATQVRYKTPSIFLGSDYVVTYWEGSCGGYGGGCDRGDTRVKKCRINDDNSLTCTQQEEAEALLNP